MIKTSLIVLAFAVFAFSAPLNVQGINDFVSGFSKTSGVPVGDLAEECITGFAGLGEHDYLQGKPTTEDEQVELVINALSVFEVCAQSFGEAHGIIRRELHMLLANRELYFAHFVENHEQVLTHFAVMIKALHNQNYFKAGKKLGKIAHIVFGKNNEEIHAIRKETIKAINVGALNPNTTGVYGLLDNATLFIEGYGNGFNIDNTAEDLVDAEVDIASFVNCTEEFYKNATHDPNIQALLETLNCAWNGFSGFVIQGTQGADQVYTIYEPAIQLAEKNVTQVQVDFENNLKTAPLKTGFDLLALKTDWQAGNYFGAGNAAGALSTIGLKGLVNVTSEF
jgi:hypothetical protein